MCLLRDSLKHRNLITGSDGIASGGGWPPKTYSILIIPEEEQENNGEENEMGREGENTRPTLRILGSFLSLVVLNAVQLLLPTCCNPISTTDSVPPLVCSWKQTSHLPGSPS